MLAAVALPITQISERFEISRQGVTKHIKTLEKAGLVQITAVGRERFCNANPKELKQAMEWFQFYEGFWNNALGNLGQYLDDKGKG